MLESVLVQKLKMGRLLLPIFIVVNLVLYYFSYDGATFIEGADASQYYIPAVSLLESGQFMLGDDLPLTFGPPFYSIFLAIPIGIFGLEGSDTAIVILQVLMLFVTGNIFKLIFLSLYSGPSKNTYAALLHALVIFNPNSLITAHLVQSETLFTLLFSIALFFSIKLLSDFSLRNLVLIGLFLGFATLTRSVSIYFLIASPLFLWIVMILQGKRINKSKLTIPLLIGAIVISPWYVRNYVEFGEVFYTANAGSYLKSQYIQLKHKGLGWSIKQGVDRHNEQFEKYLHDKSVKRRNFCLEHEKDWSCNSLLSNLSLKLILQEPPVVHAKALVDSWGTLFLAGGASNIRNYLGIEGKSIISEFQNRPFNGIESIKDLLNGMNFSYFMIFIATTLFTVITRAIGIIGLFYIIKDRKWMPYGVLFVEVILLFTAAYLYLGQSRFRVPIEPMLMLFTVFGLIYFMNRKKSKLNGNF